MVRIADVFVFRHKQALLALTVFSIISMAWAKDVHSTDTTNASRCANVPHSNHPKAFLSNGKLDALVYLPDAAHGYYRASRFDWAGVVGCVSYKGHTYFGEWFPKYGPLENYSITGPVEEFRVNDGVSGYGKAQADGLFVKIGVGVLRKVGDSPYKFDFTYPLVDSGQRSVQVKKRSIVFTQRLQGPYGIAYVYTKILELDRHRAVMTVEHKLKNVGKAIIDTEVYDHDFYMLDDEPTGPGMVIHFAFEPKAVSPLGPSAKIEGKDLIFISAIKPQKYMESFLTGYSDKAADYDITVENRDTKVGVEQTSDTPISKLNLWSIRTTICPEAYVHLNIPPGKTRRWKIRYRFFADSK